MRVFPKYHPGREMNPGPLALKVCVLQMPNFTCDQSIDIIFYFFIGMPHLAAFIFNFSLMYTNSSQIAYIHPVCQGLNPQPLGHEPSVLTTRPWLLA